MFKDFLHKAGIIINCKTLTVEWQGKSIPMNSKFFQGASSGMCRLRVNYTLPINSDIVRKRQGYKYMTKLDLSMMFYAIELTDQAKEIAVISTHFGNFSYQRAPMGLRNSPALLSLLLKIPCVILMNARCTSMMSVSGQMIGTPILPSCQESFPHWRKRASPSILSSASLVSRKEISWDIG